MKHKQVDTAYILKIEKDEEVIAALAQFCAEQGVTNASIVGLGAVDWIQCGYYDLKTKEYVFQEYDGLYEVLNATGNVMLKEGKPMVHLHATFSDTENRAFGGHVAAMRVGVVLEVILTPLSSTIERKLDEQIGLFLMDLD
jgi:uncharacterized protein